MTNLINLGGGNTDFYIGDRKARIYLGETLLYPLDAPEPEEGQYHLSDFSRDASDASSLKDGDKVIIVWAGENRVDQTIATANLSSYMLAPQGGNLKNLASYNNDNNTGKGPTPSDDEFIDAAVWEVARKGDEMALRNVKTGLWMTNNDEAHKNNHRVTFSSDPYYFTVGRLKIGDAVSFTVTSNSTIEVNNYYHYNYDFEWYETGTAGGNIFLFYKYDEPKNYLAKINDSIEIPCDDLGRVSSDEVGEYKDIATKIEFGDCTKNISLHAFEGWTGLTGDLVIPDSVESIQYMSFYHCSGFNGTLTLGNGLTSLGALAFDSCSGFTGDLVIPKSLPVIGNNAFYKCSGFSSLTIPDTVQTIYYHAFSNCSGLTKITVEAKTPCELDDNVFWGTTCPIYVPCESVEAYKAAPNWSNYADRITCIENKNYLVKLNDSIEIPCNDGILTSDMTSPYQTTATSLKFGDCLTAINNRAFYSFKNLEGDLIIPDNVEKLGDYAFNGCSGFNGKLVLSNNISYINQYVFYNCIGFTGELVIPNSVTEIGKSAFYNCSGFTGTLTIPSNVQKLNDFAFINCSGFTGDLVIPDSVTEIGGSAFSGCKGFKGTLTLPKNIKEIAGFTFYGCSGLTGDLVIPDSVTTIGNDAFDTCSGLNGTLTIGDKVGKIGDWAFNGCNKLKLIKIKSSSVPTAGNKAFDNTNDCPIYVRCHLVDTYKHDINWSKYADRIKGWDFDNDRECPAPITATTIYYTDGSELKIDDSETALGPDLVTDYGAHDITDIKSAEIGPNIDQFLNKTFDGASNLESVKFAENSKIGKINNYSFRNCTSLKEIDMSSCKELGIIGDSAFNGCKMLTKMVLPDSLYGYTIGRSITTNALALEEVVIGSGCISIGNSAFAKYGLGPAYKVIMHDTTPPTVGTFTFDNSSTAYIDEPCTIYVPDSAVDEYKSSWSVYASQIHPISEL